MTTVNCSAGPAAALSATRSASRPLVSPSRDRARWHRESCEPGYREHCSQRGTVAQRNRIVAGMEDLREDEWTVRAGDVLAVTEGPRVVAYLTVEAVD